jgi:hypothetical protein
VSLEAPRVGAARRAVEADHVPVVVLARTADITDAVPISRPAGHPRAGLFSFVTLDAPHNSFFAPVFNFLEAWPRDGSCFDMGETSRGRGGKTKC